MMIRKYTNQRWFFPTCLAVLLVVFFSALPAVFAQGASDATVSIQVTTPVPQFSLTNPGGQLEVHWNWDYVAPGYVPPGVQQMEVEISDDGLIYNNLQIHAPGDFLATYLSLPPATYTARVTVIDGNDFDFAFGPVTIVAGGGGRRIDPPPAPDTTDVTITGLAYPGPSTVVIFTYNTNFQSNILTDADGRFSFNTASLPAGAGVLSFTARDPDNVLSSTLLLNANIPLNTPHTIDSVNLPPTLTISQDTAVTGEIITVNGYAYKNGSVSVTVDGPSSLAMLVQAESDGAWEATFNTNPLVPGSYTIFAIASSVTGVTSPESEQAQLQITTPFPSAPVCNDGVIDASEQCDDGNVVNGDGCSDTCQLEAGLPQSTIDQPVPSVQSTNGIDLSYAATSPNGSISSVRIFYSRNGAPYVQFNGTYTTSPVQLTDLLDGDYEVYSIATDNTGAVEQPPGVPDATFVIDAVVELNVLAYPEKRLPRQGNWSMPASLKLYQPLTTTLLNQYELTTDNQGRADIAVGNLPEQNYTFLLKGASQLSKRLESPSFRGVDLFLDFSFSGAFFLLSGDVYADDYINGLDLSSTVIRLYSGFLNADLNRDGLVNGMDLSIIITNLYKAGDGV